MASHPLNLRLCESLSPGSRAGAVFTGDTVTIPLSSTLQLLTRHFGLLRPREPPPWKSNRPSLSEDAGAHAERTAVTRWGPAQFDWRRSEGVSHGLRRARGGGGAQAHHRRGSGPGESGVAGKKERMRASPPSRRGSQRLQRWAAAGLLRISTQPPAADAGGGRGRICQSLPRLKGATWSRVTPLPRSSLHPVTRWWGLQRPGLPVSFWGHL